MPLSSRAKLLMGAQATAALLVTLVIVTRAVGAIQYPGFSQAPGGLPVNRHRLQL